MSMCFFPFLWLVQLCLRINSKWVGFIMESMSNHLSSEPVGRYPWSHIFHISTVRIVFWWRKLVWCCWWCLSALKWSAVVVMMMIVCTVCIPIWECIGNRAVFVVVAPYRRHCGSCCENVFTIESLIPWLCTWIPWRLYLPYISANSLAFSIEVIHLSAHELTIIFSIWWESFGSVVCK